MRTHLMLPILGLLSLCPVSAAAQSEAAGSYPERPVKVIVPYAAGAAADVIGRIVATKLSEYTGTQFYVENLPGAGSVTGTVAAARAPADGHTILVMNQDFVVQPLVRSTAPYNPFRASCRSHPLRPRRRRFRSIRRCRLTACRNSSR
jgi:Uncharacterized protein conserved in bacteria